MTKSALEAAGVDLGREYEALIDGLADWLVKPGDIVIDGGANSGRHTIPLARRVAPDGRVHAFEPLGYLIDENREWARSEGVDACISYHAFALTDRAGDADFVRDIDNPALSSLMFASATSRTERIAVPTRTLDDILPDDIVTFIKMDIEGAEYRAFSGGRRLIARARPFIVFENSLAWAAERFDYDKAGFFGLFADLGLTLFDAFGEPFRPASWMASEVGWYFCAVPTERLPGEAVQRFIQEFWQSRVNAAQTAPHLSQESMDLSPAAVLPHRLLANARVVPSREAILYELPQGLVFCEIGVALGDFADRVLAICQPKEFIAVDIFTLDAYPEMWDGRVGRELAGRSHLDYVTRRFSDHIAAGRFRLTKAFSTEAIAQLPQDLVDVFYIDAHHSFESVAAELQAVEKKIRAGGYIILNDYIMMDHYTNTRYGVVQAVNSFMIKENWEMIYFALHPGMFCDVALRRCVT